MSGGSLPPGFRFHPTDEELIDYYFKRKVEGLKIELEVTGSQVKSQVVPQDRKYPHGSRTNRATKAGYWKATGKDRKICCQSSPVGYRKSLVFYTGRAPHGERMDWLMHEYRLSDDLLDSARKTNFQGEFVLCRVLKRNDMVYGSKNLVSGSRSRARNSTFVSNELSNERQPPTNYEYHERNYSMPYVSPCSIAASQPEYTNPSHFRVSPDFNVRTSANEGVCGAGTNISSPWLENIDYMSIWGNDDVTLEDYSLLNEQNLF
ncbi:hypothetical protein QQ045_019344 [Rhodiola kirilowii]